MWAGICESAWQSCGWLALPQTGVLRIVSFAVAPDVSSQNRWCTACSPLEDCRSPHRQTETGPLAGPGFLFALPNVATRRDARRKRATSMASARRRRGRRLDMNSATARRCWLEKIPGGTVRESTTGFPAAAGLGDATIIPLSCGRPILGLRLALHKEVIGGKRAKSLGGTGRIASRCSRLMPAASAESPAKSGISAPRAK